jgi:hypothetical protein
MGISMTHAAGNDHVTSSGGASTSIPARLGRPHIPQDEFVVTCRRPATISGSRVLRASASDTSTASSRSRILAISD